MRSLPPPPPLNIWKKRVKFSEKEDILFFQYECFYSITTVLFMVVAKHQLLFFFLSDFCIWKMIRVDVWPGGIAKSTLFVFTVTLIIDLISCTINRPSHQSWAENVLEWSHLMLSRCLQLALYICMLIMHRKNKNIFICMLLKLITVKDFFLVTSDLFKYSQTALTVFMVDTVFNHVFQEKKSISPPS